MKKIIDKYNAWAHQYDYDINPTRDLDKSVTIESLSNIDFFKVFWSWVVVQGRIRNGS